MENLVLIVHVLLAAGVIALVLLQHGKGADAGASFGGGASQTVFGSQGSGNFLTRTTAVLATLFFVTSFALAIFAKNKAVSEGDVIPDPLLTAPVVEEMLPALPATDTNAPVNSDLPQVPDA